MYYIANSYKTNLKDSSKRQSFLLIPYSFDATQVPTFFFSDDNDFSDAGITICDYYCTGEDLRFGESPAATLSCEIINRYGLVTQEDLQDMVAYIGVEMERSDGSDSDAEITIGNDHWYAKSDGFYKGTTKLASGNFVSLMGIHSVNNRATPSTYLDIIFAFSSEGVYVYKDDNGTVDTVAVVPCTAYMMAKFMTRHSMLFTYTYPLNSNATLSVTEITEDITINYTYCPMGVFTLNKSKITNTNVITLTDCTNQMSVFDKWADNAIAYLKSQGDTATAKEICDEIKYALNLTGTVAGFDNTIELPLKDIDNHSTYRQLLNWVAERFMGTILMNRQDSQRFDLRQLGTVMVKQYESDDISSDGFTVDTYATNPVTGVRLTLTDGSVIEYGDQTNPYSIYNNPLFGDSLSQDFYNSILTTPVYNAVACTIINAEPWIDVGDVINIPMSIANGYVYAGGFLEALSDEEMVAVYQEEAQYVTCPLLQRTFRWNGRTQADYMINGNQFRQVDEASVYASSDPGITQETLNDGFTGKTSELLNAYGDLAHTGNVVTSSESAVSVSSGSAKTLSSKTFTKGVWLVMAWARFASNATGYRRVLLSSSQDSSIARSMNASTIVNAVDGANTEIEVVTVVRISNSGETIYMNAVQNSGSALNVTPRFFAVQIA